MQTLTASQIRQRFLGFFKEHGHAVVPSASLVPDNDPTVLFTTAGMHPLVPYLQGELHPLGRRLASAQKCLRTGDIDEVGDNRHLTFFEMLGNWSLGDYFKHESIRWSFHFLTSEDEGLGLDPSKLFVTVFAGDADAPQDGESIGIWKEVFASVGITAEVDIPISQGGRIFTLAKDSNWWGPAGQTGPCGPDTEIFYDDGVGAQTLPSGMPDFDSGCLIEIWNNVFMQYDKQADGTFTRLAQHNVDTGMGLERITAVVQGVGSVFETDLFTSLLEAITHHAPAASAEAQRVIADHLKAAAFLIGDGVFPSNKDRGYVVRRLIRRAVLMSELDEDERALKALLEGVMVVLEKMYAEQYPVFATPAERDKIVTAILTEGEKFRKSLGKGKREIEKRQNLTGKDAFDLYQTYGFPLELTREYAQSRGVDINEAEFEAEFTQHQNLSRTASAGQFSSGLADHSEQTVKYHTGTHLLHEALRRVLGEHVQQKGSNITAERLRFDFAHPEKLTAEQLAEVTKLVNDTIKADLPITRGEMSPDEAFAKGYLGFFGHKYGSVVSVYDMGGFSKEICTGPHLERTGGLGTFVIQKEEAVSAGVRRIKAILE